MASVGSPVGMDPPPRRIVYTDAKNKAKDAATIIGPAVADRRGGRKLSGNAHRAPKARAMIAANSTGGWNATPALSAFLLFTGLESFKTRPHFAFGYPNLTALNFGTRSDLMRQNPGFTVPSRRATSRSVG